jgi:orotidine-5'-phosphate decarboxylase
VSSTRPDFAIAFDVPSLGEALALNDKLGGGDEFAKLGLELFVAEGPAVVREFKARGRRVFLDLKLHDIPNTVKGAAASAAKLGADLLTVHATGGAEMVAAAVSGIREAGGATRVVAVTVLTSHDPEHMPAGFAKPFDLSGTAISLTREALSAGASGIVCAAPDLRALRAALGPDFYAVTPGIRMSGGETHDQKRVATVEGAVRDGASLLVLGRAVTAAADPRAALEAARAERDRAMAVR